MIHLQTHFDVYVRHFGVSAKISISHPVAKLNYGLSLSLCFFFFPSITYSDKKSPIYYIWL